MLPSFVSHDLATKILLVGKSINFMRRCCKEVPYECVGPSKQRVLEVCPRHEASLAHHCVTSD